MMEFVRAAGDRFISRGARKINLYPVGIGLTAGNRIEKRGVLVCMHQRNAFADQQSLEPSHAAPVETRATVEDVYIESLVTNRLAQFTQLIETAKHEAIRIAQPLRKSISE